jgi:hypothetical protein
MRAYWPANRRVENPSGNPIRGKMSRPVAAGDRPMRRNRQVPSHTSDFWPELRFRLDERVDVPEALVAMLQEIFDGLSEKRLEVPV